MSAYLSLRSAPPSNNTARTLPASLSALALVACSLLAVATAAATDLSGPLSGYLPAGIYHIVGDISVDSGSTLTLAPGVDFRFRDSLLEEYEFEVNGTLLAIGTPENPIIFQTAVGVAEFNYIRIRSSASQLSYCTVEHGGKLALQDEGGLWIDGCSPRLDHCIVRDGAWHGIYLTGAGARPEIRWTRCESNSGDGIDAYDGAGLMLVNCEIRGNGGDGVCVSSGENVIAGCLIVANGEDGIDSRGSTSFAATIVNSTIADNGAECLADASLFNLYNSIALGGTRDVGGAENSCMVADPGYYHFRDQAGGDYRLADDSPCLNLGSRFGPPADWLLDVDLDGAPRICGIIDAGAYESARLPDPGEDGLYFSAGLISPRMTQPVIVADGEDFTAAIGLLGDYSAGEIAAELVNPLAVGFPVDVTSVTSAVLSPGSAWADLLYTPGLEVIQEIGLAVPAGTPPDFYDLRIAIGAYEYHSIHAVRVVDGYPAEWRFIHITDPHLGYSDEEFTAAERYRHFTQEANFLHPDLVIVTGDLCENHNLENTAFMDTLLAITAALRVPIFMQPGNHEYYNADGQYHPGYPLNGFERISRFVNAHFTFGRAQFLAFSTGADLGLSELYRCQGPSSAALDWAQELLATLSPEQQPRFFMMHGPCYDYMSWNVENVGRVRDLMAGFGVSLCLAGHTHRFETFRNEGDNYLGRNDFLGDQDWSRDVPFPGFPLHVQTSSLGEELHPAPESGAPAESGRGLFGDDIAWRYVRVVGGEVTCFTADTDGDGYRSTENLWLLGDLQFTRETLPDGTIIATVQNDHYETWTDVRHWIPTDPATEYDVAGGTLVRRYPDGIAEVAVDVVASGASSIVTLTPISSHVNGISPALQRWSIAARQNPFSHAMTFAISCPHAGESSSGNQPELAVFDATGRLVRDLSGLIASHRALQPFDSAVDIVWDGADENGRPVSPGAYFVRLGDRTHQTFTRVLCVR